MINLDIHCHNGLLGTLDVLEQGKCRASIQTADAYTTTTHTINDDLSIEKLMNDSLINLCLTIESHNNGEVHLNKTSEYR